MSKLTRLIPLPLLAISPCFAVHWTNSQAGPATWTYTLQIDPEDNLNVSQASTTITMTGLTGVTAATAPTFTDLPPGLACILNWTPQVLNGGTKVVWTNTNCGSGNFPDTRHVYGFSITAAGAPNGTASFATSGFQADDNGANLDISGAVAGPSATPPTPTVTKFVNNYSFTGPGFPNSGIAPSTIATIFGSALSGPIPNPFTLNPSPTPGLPTTSNGAQVTISAGGKTFNPGIYYAIPTQIAVVVPAGVPTGAASATVTYNGQTSAPFPIQIVAQALGLDTYFGTGSGLITATDAISGVLITPASPAQPGQILTLWGSGLGADSQDSDTVFTTTPHAVNQAGTQIWFGGVQAAVGYAGSSGYPGLVQINTTVPAGVSGCAVSVVGVVNGVSSNFGTIPVNSSSGECSDPAFGAKGGSLVTLSGQSSVKAGTLIIGQSVSQNSGSSGVTTSNTASGSFHRLTGTNFGGASSYASLGSCFVTQTAPGAPASTPAGLDAGAIMLSGPGGATYPLTPLPADQGSYSAQLPAGGISTAGGTFVFTGAGGADVGAFTGSVTLPTPALSWTNQSAVATVTRSNGATVTWSGGTQNGFVLIQGTSTDSSTAATGSFSCYAPQSALSFTIPKSVTNALPAGTGTLSLGNDTNFNSFSASGLDYGFLDGLVSSQINVTYR